MQNARLVLVGLTHEMSYTADSILDSIRIRIVTPDSIRFDSNANGRFAGP